MSSPVFLFTVKAHFLLTVTGLTLCPDSVERRVSVGSKLKILTPDKNIVEALVMSISFHELYCLSVGNDFTKEDIPVGSEVWVYV